MIELLKGLGPLQWVLIGVGLLFIAPAMKNFLASLVSKTKPSVPVINFATSDNLTSIVQKWEMLHDACVAAGLADAQDKLHEVFPLLAKKPLAPSPENSDAEV